MLHATWQYPTLLAVQTASGIQVQCLILFFHCFDCFVLCTCFALSFLQKENFLLLLSPKSLNVGLMLFVFWQIHSISDFLIDWWDLPFVLARVSLVIVIGYVKLSQDYTKVEHIKLWSISSRLDSFNLNAFSSFRLFFFHASYKFLVYLLHLDPCVALGCFSMSKIKHLVSFSEIFTNDC